MSCLVVPLSRWHGHPWVRFHLVNFTNPHRHCSPGADCKHKHPCQASTGPLSICCSYLLQPHRVDSCLHMIPSSFCLATLVIFFQLQDFDFLFMLLAMLPQSCPTLSHGLQPTRLLCPWDSPAKNTEVGCHALPSRGSSWHRLRICICYDSWTGRQILYH